MRTRILRQAWERLAARWDRVGESRNETVRHLPRPPVGFAGSVLMAALLTVTTPTPLQACSWGTFIEVQPELYFVFTALPDTVEAEWSGAVDVRSRSLEDRGHLSPEGPLWGQVVRLNEVGGDAAKRVPADSERMILVPWTYSPDCRPLPWQGSARFLETGERGLIYASLRDPEHWVDGIPTADFHLPHSQPYPRRARYVLPPLMSVDDAFQFHNVLPRPDDLRDDPAAAIAPLLEWARKNPELAVKWPANDMIQRHLERITHEEVRRVEVPVAVRTASNSIWGAARPGPSMHPRTRLPPARASWRSLRPGATAFFTLHPDRAGS